MLRARRSPRVIALALWLALAACGATDFGGPAPLAPPPVDVAPRVAEPARASASADDVPILVTADRSDGAGVVVSLGVPLPPGKAMDEAALGLVDAKGASLPHDAKVLARWPLDGSIRSLLLAFRMTLGPRESAVVRLAPNRPGAKETLAPNPDGPFVATLPAQFYADARATGPSLPVAKNPKQWYQAARAFPRYLGYRAKGLPP